MARNDKTNHFTLQIFKDKVHYMARRMWTPILHYTNLKAARTVTF